jgi:acyl-CoA thioester hydrolase
MPDRASRAPATTGQAATDVSMAVDDGRLVGQEHRYRLRVFYEDTDAGGVVYHANYLRFAERARTSFLRLVGIGQSALRAEHGVGFVVRRCEIDFAGAATLDDVLEVRSTLSDVKGASLSAEQRIYRVAGTEVEDGADSRAPLCVLGLLLACVGPAGRPARFPPQLRGALAGVSVGGPTTSTG